MTSQPVYKYEFKCKFENYSELPCLSKLSPIFCFYPIPGHEWTIEFEKGNKYLFAYLCSKNTVAVNLVYESKICDNTGREYYAEHKKFNKIGEVKIDLLSKFTSLIELKQIPDDILILKCGFQFYDIETPEVEMIYLNLEDNTNAPAQLLLSLEDNTDAPARLLINLASMFKKSEHCDVTLKVDGVSIETHKAILCANSPIFSTMLTHNMKETANNIIDITDISGPIMKQFTSLLYCPILKTPLDFETACNLYYASDKYEVLSIRSMIGKELINLLNKENALEILSLADHHNDNGLKEEIVKYVKSNLKSIVNLDSWEKFVVSNGRLASTLITNYFNEFIN